MAILEINKLADLCRNLEYRGSHHKNNSALKAVNKNVAINSYGTVL